MPDDLGLGSAGAHRGFEVIVEGGLWASVRLGDNVTKLVCVMSDAVVLGVVLPISIEDAARVESLMVKAKLLEELCTSPARNLFTRGKFADSDRGEVGKALEECGEHQSILSRGGEIAIREDLIGMGIVDVVDGPDVGVGELEASPDLQVLPSPSVAILVLPQALCHQCDVFHVARHAGKLNGYEYSLHGSVRRVDCSSFGDLSG